MWAYSGAEDPTRVSTKDYSPTEVEKRVRSLTKLTAADPFPGPPPISPFGVNNPIPEVNSFLLILSFASLDTFSSDLQLTRMLLWLHSHEHFFQSPPSSEEFLAKKAAGEVDIDLIASAHTSMSEEEAEEGEANQCSHVSEEQDELLDSGSSSAPVTKGPIDATPLQVLAPESPPKKMCVEVFWDLSSG